MKDAVLKDMLFKHYWALGCFVQTEVDIHFQEGVDGQPKPITDVDVYILRPHPDLYFERILGDCKNANRLSPVSRSLWLRGLMDLLKADTGCLLVGQTSRIERDHKLTADHLGINLLNAHDFQVYDRAVLFPLGSSHIRISPSDINALKTLASRFPKLLRLNQYLYRDAWKENSSELIRHLLSAVKQTRAEFDPAKKEHAALLCDAAAIFAVGLAEIAGTIFKQYLHPEDKETLVESLRVILWGGRDNYENFSNLRRLVIERKLGQPGEDIAPLGLPEWNQFVQLVRALLDSPHAAFQVPQLLRQMAVDIMNVEPILPDVDSRQLQALKFAMMTLSYVCRASGVPSDFEGVLISMLVDVQGRFATANARRRTPERSDPDAEKQEAFKLSDSDVNVSDIGDVANPESLKALDITPKPEGS